MSAPQIDQRDEEYREDLVQYRSPAVLAIVTLVLGPFSFLALLKPILWVFPLITIGVGFAALYNLAKNPLKIGRKAALIGLALAFFFLAWGCTHYYSRREWLAHHARQYADTWLELIRSDRLRDAHQLHLRKSLRVADGVSIDDYYATQPYAQADFESFFDKMPLKKLLELGAAAQVTFQRVESYDAQPTSDMLILDYLVKYQDAGRPKTLPMRIVMVRDRDPAAGEFNWCVDRVEPPHPSAH
jgi:hypothetical protein